MEEFYNTNSDFKAYVDKYIAKESVSLNTALSHAMVRNYAEYLMERGKAEPRLLNMWSAGSTHDNVSEV